MKTTTENNVQVQHQDIAELAKQIWEREGRQVGRDLEHWLRAERQLLANRKRASDTTTDPSPPIRSPQTGTINAIKLPASIAKLAHT